MTLPFPEGDYRNDEVLFDAQEEKRVELLVCKKMRSALKKGAVGLAIGGKWLYGGAYGWILYNEDAGNTIITHCPFCGEKLPKLNKLKRSL